MPLQLEITPAALAPQFAQPTLDYLFAVFVWPGFGQADRRREFVRSYAAFRMAEEAKAVPGSMRVEMIEQALHAEAPASFSAEYSRRAREGARVGAFYADALALSRVGVPVSVKQLRSFHTRPGRHPALKGISESQLRDLLREYRPAAHLWTAFFMSAGQNIDTAIPPCAPHRIGAFLASSEWVADRLGEIQLDRRNKPLIGPDLWRVTPAVAASLPAPDIHDLAWPADQPALPHDIFKLYEAVRLPP